ncbi:MAG: LCP family protein [Actinobacteria bacterium]|nr:LCP family protein [Actinomycetota bacterium]
MSEWEPTPEQHHGADALPWAPNPGPGRTGRGQAGASGLLGVWRRRKRWILAGIAVAMVAAIAIPAARIWIAWSRIERVPFDPIEARLEMTEQAALAAPADTTTTTTLPAGDAEPAATTSTVAEPGEVPFDGTVDDDDHTAVLIIGSDAGGFRADVIMLALIPNRGGDLALVSLPRDLYLDDPCTGGRQRINAALNGCGGVSGPNLLAIVVEDFTGVPVDHFVLFDFDGFARVIDAAGGVDVCVPHYTYDTKTDPELQLLAGCNHLGGPMALSWVRSRHTREVVDGVDRAVAGVSDLTRNERQREIVLDLLGRLSSFPNPSELVGLVEAVPGAFTLSAGLSLTAAVGIAWDLRGTPPADIATPEIPVTNHVTANGAQVLLPAESFAETMGWAAPS